MAKTSHYEKLKQANLSRAIYQIPDFVEQALKQASLWQRYQARPAYQQNDYIGWIIRAKRPETQNKRLQQMLAELCTNDRYMKMPYKGSDRTS
jgi:uncharacterized protein YdeI (YjbR/CyaY-like superfamily)